MRSRTVARWGAGGAKVEGVHVGDPSEDATTLDITIAYETSELRKAVFCVGFVDEGGHEIGVTASPAVPLEVGKGRVQCSLDLRQFRPGSYFPVVAIVSEDGVVRDRWRLDRAFVVERNGRPDFIDDFGPVQIGAAWSEKD